MTSSSALDKLERILKLEQDQHHNNRAVIGGMERFLQFWEKQARDEVGSTGERLVDDLMAWLEGYQEMSVQERGDAIHAVLERLAGAPAEPDDAPAAKASMPRPTRVPAEEHPRAERPQPRPERRQIREQSVTDENTASLAASVETLTGVGPATAEHMARLGIETIRDLIYHFPRRYDDFGQLKPIKQLALDEEVTVVGVVRNAQSRRISGGRTLFSITLSDGTGVIECSWFSPYLKDQLEVGSEIAVSGRVGEYRGRLNFTAPEWEPLKRNLLHTNRLVPVYALTEGLHMRSLRRLIRDTLKEWVPRILDPLPQEILDSAGLIDLRSAITQIHFPKDHAALAQARERLCFDELLLLQLGVLSKRSEWRDHAGAAINVAPGVVEDFVASLPYDLTGAQQRTLREILYDMAQPVPMSRLLQGDVGSGKTVVAVAAMLAAVRAGYQAALMAPTSILAEQHHATLQEMLAPYPDVRTDLLVGGLPAEEKERVRQELAAGDIHIITGTHALIQETVDFDRLGLVIVDEQHRFGVLQRETLRDKAESIRPHMLAMSATPIPRTLALTVYGDLDVSTLDELPPHRQEILTAVRTHSSRERIYSFIRSQIENGRQAFVICPLVKESEHIEAKSAVEEFEYLSQKIFSQFRLGLLHGRVGAEEKERVMAAFNAGEYDILVSTAVVEVGIDVPNATVMFIEGAERFGLAQLHQFRGRVGRGAERSYCILMADSQSGESLERLRIMEDTNDGFVLAEKDLELRGPGDLIGVRQHGLPELKVATMSDRAVLEKARREALRIHEQDPDLAAPQHRALAYSVAHFWSSVALS